MNNISRTITGLLVLTFLFFGLSEMNYTGNIVNSLEKIPIVVAEFNYEDDSFSEDVHKKFISGTYSLPNIDEGKYLILGWNNKITNFNIVVSGHSNFEIWSGENALVASGKIDSDNFKEYNFELNSDISNEDYAIFNHGTEKINIKSISAVGVPESKLNKFLELIAEGFV